LQVSLLFLIGVAMSNHTPGPWERRKRMVPIIDEKGFTWDGDYVIWQSDVPLAEVNCCDGVGEQQARHNASLIAAAPEMLHALEAATHVMPLGEEYDAVVEAIAKVKGETDCRSF